MVTLTKRASGRCPTHPGAMLREIVLPAMPISKTEFAKSLGISRQSLYDVLDEKQPVTPLMAVRLGLFFGDSAASWLNMQSAYDLWHAERKIDRSKVTPLKRAS
jgi:antitoxin HigA-1